MRYNGTLKSWNDNRGFGFIESTQGGQALFVHIKAFENRATRPHIGQVVSFEAEFRAAFWGSVVLNAGVFVGANSPWFHATLLR